MTQPVFLSRPWGKLAYWYERSREPALVLIHGAWCDARDWDAMLPFLPPGRGILRFDLRGHGQSDGPAGPVTFDDHVDDVVALLDYLDLAPPVVIGHSLGGMLGMRLAELFPRRTCGLVLLEGWTYLGVPWTAKGEMYGMLPDDIVARIKRKWEEAQQRWPQAVWNPYWETVRRADASRFLGATRLPVLEMYGDRGKPRPTREELGIPDRPNIDLAWIENAGHYLPHEVPRAVGEIISAWLEQSRLTSAKGA